MIMGLGIDVVDIERFEKSIKRNKDLTLRIFHTNELTLPIASLAARFAAKEALFKASSIPKSNNWTDIEIVKEKPRFNFHGSIKGAMQGMTVHLSLSHDAGVAIAMVLIEN
jgi:holo-[acyl-carrier protein] synthase